MGTPKATPYEIAARNLIQPAGMRSWQLNAEHPERAPGYHADKGLGEWRNCSRCGVRFEKSLKRRMLCKGCFGRATGGDEAA